MYCHFLTIITKTYTDVNEGTFLHRRCYCRVHEGHEFTNGSYFIVSFPVDGIVWGPWSTCTKTCDTGTQQRLGYLNGTAEFVHTANCGVVPCHGKFISRYLRYPALPPPSSAPVVVVTLRRC